MLAASRSHVDEDDNYFTDAPELPIVVERWLRSETGTITLGAAIPVTLCIDLTSLPEWKRPALLRLSIRALASATASGGGAQVQTVLPRHKQAVQNFFKRDEK